MKKCVHLGIALFFFTLGCGVTAFWDHGKMPRLVSLAMAGSECVRIRSTDVAVNGDKCEYTLEFNKEVLDISVASKKTIKVYFDPCLFNCQRYNPVSGTCIGASMDKCD